MNRILPLAVWIVVLVSSLGFAEPVPSPFPKGYFGHDALTDALKKVASAHPDRVRIESLAKSSQGRDVWLVTIGDKAKKTPAVLLVANLEADHLVGSQVALGLIQKLAEGAALPNATLYIVPRLNPDGAERFLTSKPAGDFRNNLRPIDRDRDGKSGEDGPDDINGDGLIGVMRVKDPKAATHIADAKDPRISRKADAAKGEKPAFSEGPEGRDDDGDGLRDEDPAGGVNLNRNWPHRWTEFDLEAGFSPASEPEVVGLIRFAFAHPEIAAVWSFGLNDNLVEEPKKPASTLDEADLSIFVELSKSYVKAVTPKDPPKGSSPAGKGSPAPGATTDGSLGEWAYHQFGVVALASRLFSTPEIPAPPEVKDEKKDKDDKKDKDEKKDKDDKKDKDAKPAIPEDAEARWLYWNDKVMNGRAFMPFVSAAHPTLGKVEIGGWKPGVRLNPPIEQLDAIRDSHLVFFKELAGKLPKLAVVDVKVVAEGKGLFEVSAGVVNEGYFPTALAQGVKTKSALPVLVKLEPGKAKLLAGRKLEKIDTLGGSGGRREFKWLVLAPEGVNAVTLDVSCPKGGKVTSEIPLK